MTHPSETCYYYSSINLANLAKVILQIYLANVLNYRTLKTYAFVSFLQSFWFKIHNLNSQIAASFNKYNK